MGLGLLFYILLEFGSSGCNDCAISTWWVEGGRFQGVEKQGPGADLGC